MQKLLHPALEKVVRRTRSKRKAISCSKSLSTSSRSDLRFHRKSPRHDIRRWDRKSKNEPCNTRSSLSLVNHIVKQRRWLRRSRPRNVPRSLGYRVKRKRESNRVRYRYLTSSILIDSKNSQVSSSRWRTTKTKKKDNLSRSKTMKSQHVKLQRQRSNDSRSWLKRKKDKDLQRSSERRRKRRKRNDWDRRRSSKKKQLQKQKQRQMQSRKRKRDYSKRRKIKKRQRLLLKHRLTSAQSILKTILVQLLEDHLHQELLLKVNRLTSAVKRLTYSHVQSWQNRHVSSVMRGRR